MMYFTNNSKHVLFIVLTCFAALASNAQCPNLVWADEFNGTSLNTQDWNVQIGDGCAEGICGWGNNEAQSYQQDNIVVSNGTLQITAKRERIRGAQYTSGRITTQGKRDYTYGRFEARIKLPQGGGLWPAFWMLSTDTPYGTWPQSGEIDIMEFIGNDPTETFGTLHYGDLFPGNRNIGAPFPFYGADFFNTFHDFAIEWQANEIKWFVDGFLFQTRTPADLAPFNWPFDHDFHFLLNVAVGGSYVGFPTTQTIFPQTMLVDWVKVYKEVTN